MASLSIFNLNIMHGRNSRSPLFPLWFGRGKIQSNLEKIAGLIAEHNPDIITLQEVDQSSVMSGNFNQFEFLNERLHYPFAYFAPSCSLVLGNKSIFVSGNAVFSKYPLDNCKSYDFDFSFPTDRMGFVVADVKLPQGQIFTVTSIHLVWLDWMRLHPRAHQLDLVKRVLKERKTPTIISGDMNCDLSGREESLRLFVNECDLKAHDAENKNLNTSPSWNPSKRIDWILLPEKMSFISYKTLPNKVSDHLAIFAEIST